MLKHPRTTLQVLNLLMKTSYRTLSNKSQPSDREGFLAASDDLVEAQYIDAFRKCQWGLGRVTYVFAGGIWASWHPVQRVAAEPLGRGLVVCLESTCKHASLRPKGSQAMFSP